MYNVKMEFNLKRARPERSEKRKITPADNQPLKRFTLRIPETLQSEIRKEAEDLGISESLYICVILETRDQEKITEILKY